MVSFVGLQLGTLPLEAGMFKVGVANWRELAGEELEGHVVAVAVVDVATVDKVDLVVFCGVSGG